MCVVDDGGLQAVVLSQRAAKGPLVLWDPGGPGLELPEAETDLFTAQTPEATNDEAPARTLGTGASPLPLDRRSLQIRWWELGSRVSGHLMAGEPFSALPNASRLAASPRSHGATLFRVVSK